MAPAPSPSREGAAVSIEALRAITARNLEVSTRVLIGPGGLRPGHASLLLVESGEEVRIPGHQHPATTEVVLVLEGTVRLHRSATDWTDLRADDAVLLRPGTSHSWTLGAPSQPAKLLMLYSPPGPERSFEGHTDPTATLPADQGGEGPNPIVKRAADATEHFPPGGKGILRVYFERGGAAVYLGRLSARQSMTLEEHQHPDTSEIFVVLSGRGLLTVGDARHELGPGVVAHVAPGQRHALTATSDTPLELVHYFAPSGPEQALKWKAKAPYRVLDVSPE